MHAYHIETVHNIEDEDYATTHPVCYDFLDD